MNSWEIYLKYDAEFAWSRWLLVRIIQMYFRRRFWILTESVIYQLSNGETVKVPAGFRTDLSSSPRLLWTLFPPFGDFLPAAIIHDYLYVIKYRKKEDGAMRAQMFIDAEMLRVSNVCNRNRLDNYIRYIYVRLFGWILFRRNKKRKVYSV